jgi:hypothetical protein
MAATALCQSAELVCAAKRTGGAARPNLLYGGVRCQSHRGQSVARAFPSGCGSSCSVRGPSGNGGCGLHSDQDPPQDLSSIRDNLSGDYCLVKDIDLASIANWVPIGVVGTSFTGTLDGKGHVLKNLKVSSGTSYIVLFGSVFGGTVRNLGLVGARVEELESPSTSEVGVLVGRATGATIFNVYATGRLLSSAASSYTLGGLVGVQSRGAIRRSHTALTISYANASQVGALVGLQTYDFGLTEPVSTALPGRSSAPALRPGERGRSGDLPASL